MAYTKTIWEDDVTAIEAEKLNNIENEVEKTSNAINGTESMGSIVVEDIKSKNDFPLLNNFNSAGISITSNSDGTYNITGTATANIECVLFKNIEDTIIENGGTYTLSTNQSLPTGVNSRIEFYNNTSYVRGFLTVINTASNNPTAVANTTNVNKVRFGLFVTSGTTVNITNLGIQLEKGSVATNYVECKEYDNAIVQANINALASKLNVITKNTGNAYIVTFNGALTGRYIFMYMAVLNGGFGVAGTFTVSGGSVVNHSQFLSNTTAGSVTITPSTTGFTLTFARNYSTCTIISPNIALT